MGRTAICIGINDYPGVESDLFGCVNDAKDWQALLESKGFEAELLLDQDATRDNILKSIGDRLGAAQPGDSVVVTYSGHGSFIADTNDDEDDDARDEVLCPYDVDQGHPIVDDELNDLFGSKKDGVHAVMIADSCHSGSVSRLLPPQDESGPPERNRFLPPTVFLRGEAREAAKTLSPAVVTKKERPPVVLLMAGCQDWQTSADAWFEDRANGAFTYYALRALSELPEGSNYEQWHEAIKKLLPNQRYEQIPRLDGPDDLKNAPIFGV